MRAEGAPRAALGGSLRSDGVTRGRSSWRREVRTASRRSGVFRVTEEREDRCLLRFGTRERGRVRSSGRATGPGHLACQGGAGNTRRPLKAQRPHAAPTGDGWTVNGWVESQAVPYNTVSGWDPDHCERATRHYMYSFTTDRLVLSSF